MARQPRVEYPGAVYHVTVRIVGDAWETGSELSPAACLFRDDRERERFLDQLAERVETYTIRLYAYTLMLSHYHLYLETPQANLGRFMHSLNTAYTVYSNLRRQRHGHLVGRYKAKPVEGDSYHLSLSRYVHLNPVRIKATDRLAPEEKQRRLLAYRWSSYPFYIGRQKVPDWLSCDPVLALCGRGGSRARAAYRRFVETGLTERDEEFEALLKGPSYGVGGGTFLKWVQEQMTELGRHSKHPEDVSLRHEAPAIPAEEALRIAAQTLGVDRAAFNERRRNSVLRGIGARVLCRHAGLTQRSAAAVLGVRTGAAVGLQLRAIEVRLQHDSRLRRQVVALERTLAAEAVKY